MSLDLENIQKEDSLLARIYTDLITTLNNSEVQEEI